VKKALKNQLLLTALIASPLIALYGASPFYIFNTIDTKAFLTFVPGLTINVFIYFLAHIYLKEKYPKLNLFSQFVVTYIINTVIRFVFISFIYLLDVPEPDIKNNQTIYVIMTTFAINAIVMIIVNAMVTSGAKAEAEQKLQRLQYENTEAQKQALSKQLQPHFLFNALNILKSLINTNTAKAEEYVLKLSDFLRYTVNSDTKELVTVAEELAFVNDYIELQKVRFNDSFHHEIKIGPAYQTALIPILSIQTLVENIFKHNQLTKANPINFTIEEVNNYLVVKNNKILLKSAQISNTGLGNLDKRYFLISGKNIVINDSEAFFEVKIPIL
jgi:two-component system, LytTR family, sensor kinase